MANGESPDSEYTTGDADMPVLKTRSHMPLHACEADIRLLEEGISRLRRTISHHLEGERSELSNLRRELKDTVTLVNTLRAQLAKLEAANHELAQLLNDERTANVRLSREHEEAMEVLGTELQTARLILGDALGSPAAPRNSLVVKKKDREDGRLKRAADTVRPKAGSQR